MVNRLTRTSWYGVVRGVRKPLWSECETSSAYVYRVRCETIRVRSPAVTLIVESLGRRPGMGQVVACQVLRELGEIAADAIE